MDYEEDYSSKITAEEEPWYEASGGRDNCGADHRTSVVETSMPGGRRAPAQLDNEDFD